MFLYADCNFGAASRGLTKKQVEQLLRDGRTGRIEAFTSKGGKSFAAVLKLG